MSHDPKSMAPGLVQQPPKQKVVGLKCRAEPCDSMEAVEIIAEHNPRGQEGIPSRRMYQCTKCHTTWGVPVGGAFQY